MYVPHENPLLSGTFYFIVTPAVGTKVQFFSSADLMNFSPITPASASPSGFPVAIPLSGTAQKRTFDFFPYYDGSRYYLLYVDQQPAGSGGNVTQPIAFATSPTLAGPYTQQTLGGTDYFGLGTFQTEAPAIFPLGETGCLRLVFDTWTMLTSGARQYAPVFRDSCGGAGAVFSQTSLIDGPTPLLISPSEHGTIIPLTDDRSAALVYRAVAAARSN